MRVFLVKRNRPSRNGWLLDTPFTGSQFLIEQKNDRIKKNVLKLLINCISEQLMRSQLFFGTKWLHSSLDLNFYHLTKNYKKKKNLRRKMFFLKF